MQSPRGVGFLIAGNAVTTWCGFSVSRQCSHHVVWVSCAILRSRALNALACDSARIISFIARFGMSTEVVSVLTARFGMSTEVVSVLTARFGMSTEVVSVLTALAWLVPQETAAVSARSVYTIQPCTVSLHAKPHT